ncbi:ribonucleoside-diphosphate reductase subunit alpha [bacterium NHP-B]|nr:ribonucleoside-diphosphate reductase subunit alpha [bacterium NHP-B]
MRASAEVSCAAPIVLTPDPEADARLTDFGKKTLKNRYLLQGESYQDLFMRVARTYGDDQAHAERLYGYMARQWFMPATPVLANGGAGRGLPISCFLNESSDSLSGIVDLWTENVWLASKGGGIGSYWGNVRSIGEKIRGCGETSGFMPFIKVMDMLTLAISQGDLRRGSGAAYAPIWHPEIEEFMEMRKPSGGDHNRKALNLHHGVVITDAFMEAVAQDAMFPLRSPKDGRVISKVSARTLWSRLLSARVETGEPYILYIDTVNRAIPEARKALGLSVKTSNLCSEITLPTGVDQWGEERTAVCCLSSLNVEHFLSWEKDDRIIEDCLRFLDNVLEDFIARAPASMSRAVYAAKRERSVGLGVMGFHAFLQGQSVPFESVVAKVWNKRIFKHIRTRADKASLVLGAERGPCPDQKACGSQERFSNKLAIAPTASISIICGGTSPGIEPIVSNAYTHKTLNGSFRVRNKHLMKVLEEKGKNTSKVWTSIAQHEGSVQHLDFLTHHEKHVFKTAFELDQKWLIELASDRQPFVCQAQSLNIFLPSDVHKAELHQIHWSAWKKGVKSLYYLRSKTIQRSENHTSSRRAPPAQLQPEPPLPLKYDECLSCQ